MVLVTGLGSAPPVLSGVVAAFAAGALGAKGVTGLTGAPLFTELIAMMKSFPNQAVGEVWRSALR